MHSIKLQLQIAVIVALVMATNYMTYKYVKNSTLIECGEELASLGRALDSANKKALAVENSQKQSYRVALTERNKAYDEVVMELDGKILEIERLQDETTDKCVNAPIPSGFK